MLDFELAPSVPQPDAAAYASAAAGRLLALEWGGHVRDAREIADIDAARRDE